ncbi:MAG TPA: dihydropyrimidine dehydrogenase, partial [Spirochaetales bacterium]|nr:dihydropyrimidine dehydrogenase [Spirochaetales bacterium]
MNSYYENKLTTNEEKALLDELLAKENLTPKDRMAIPVQEMPVQDPDARIHTMSEVALGYTKTQAQLEALRCLQCKTAPCIKGCPV